jgi:hypothetical protein
MGQVTPPTNGREHKSKGNSGPIKTATRCQQRMPLTTAKADSAHATVQ